MSGRDRNWMDCGKAMLMEVSHGRARAGRMFRRFPRDELGMRHGSDEELCGRCAHRAMGTMPVPDLHGTWRWAYVLTEKAVCTHCGCRMRPHESVRVTRAKHDEQRERAVRDKRQAARDRAAGKIRRVEAFIGDEIVWSSDRPEDDSSPDLMSGKRADRGRGSRHHDPTLGEYQGPGDLPTYSSQD